MANIKLTELTELLTVNNSNTILYAADLSVSPNVSHFLRVGSISSLSDYTIANAAFLKANTAYNVGYNANTALNVANLAYLRGNVAFNQANSATVLAQSSFNKANDSTVLAQSSFNKANSTSLHANSAYNLANSSSSSITASFNRANAAFIQANSAFDKANSISLVSVTATAQASFNKANNAVMKAGDAITGIVTAPTAANATSNTMLATTQFVQNSISLIPNLALGVGQSWQDVKLLRASGISYTNNTGKPIMVMVSAIRVNSSSSMTVVVNGVTIVSPDASGVWYGSYDLSFVVPAGHTYSVTGSIRGWAELR